MARKAATVRYLAFLRGINVGGHRVKMENLRSHFEALGFANVSTFIASGNVIFDAHPDDPSAIEAKIEAHLRESLGYGAETFLRTPEELAEIAARRPFGEAADDPAYTVHVAFLKKALGPDAARALLSFHTDRDEFHVGVREYFWLCRGKSTDSLVPWPKLAKAVPASSTLRNLKTVQKLTALHPPPSGRL